MARILVSLLVLLAVVAQVAANPPCSAGYYSSNGKSPCYACPAGTYASQTSQTSCTLASPGWYVSGSGSQAQTPCGQGYYSAAGASQCTICPAGSYCNSNTNAAPTLCEPGRFSANPGAKQDCDRCPRGTFSSISGATKCCTCCSGYYNDQVGQPSCFKCPNKGNFQQGWSPAGSISPLQCIATDGALSSCSQDSSGTCPAAGGAVSSQLRRAATTGGYCGKSGYKSCPVWNAITSNSGHGTQTTMYKYECVNIASDVESCGGCVDDPRGGNRSADGGRDCSAIPNVDDVICSRGSCNILKCSKGSVLSADKENCVPPIKRSHSKRDFHHDEA
ncbi:hypothetical protein OE88DRAFT_598954 [Heliocybe sulcata]|uniref:Tyrosine-protein kinase ephrin type A/B receptor-like domain-containing protein n=1 Tax=Heliocybe sulcata TaxID=5364 RepID=A0A5C3MT16_9AGAM|nr:hypothetical protein OE88DRAFT_598954 [Heliocybe sulcata]